MKFINAGSDFHPSRYCKPETFNLHSHSWIMPTWCLVPIKLPLVISDGDMSPCITKSCTQDKTHSRVFAEVGSVAKQANLDIM